MNFRALDSKIKRRMTKTSIIRLSYIVSPDLMGKQWKAKLFEKMSQDITGKCTQENGYILALLRLDKVVDQTIMRTGGKVRFTVDMEASVLKPNVGEELEAEIDMITPHGLFCRHKMLRMLLPLSNCPDFILRQDFSSTNLYNPHQNKSFRKGDTIHVKVENVRFENDLYTCIVSLVV